MGQIDRNGRVVFGDATLSVWEEGFGGSPQKRIAWEKAFKYQVFKRIIQTLNRIGWELVIPQNHIEQYGQSFAEGYRYCVKGDLKADLSISGRCIELKMFQNVHAPDRPDNEGRYQSNKEKHMPYLMRLEVERTRRRIKIYLCNVFSGYEFKTDRIDGRMNKCGPNHLTALEWIQGCYETSWHFNGDLTTYKISDYNLKSANGPPVSHGQRVWFADWKGRICTGTAYYNINNMWWVVTGKYNCRNIASFELFTVQPDNLRQKRNKELREKTLKKLLNESVEVMAFERSAQLRDILYPFEDAVKAENTVEV